MDWYLPAGTTADGQWSLHAAMRYPSLRILTLPPGGTRTFRTGELEMLVLPLSGSCRVSCGGRTHELDGRTGVFDAVSDFSYLPRNATVTVHSERGGRFALPGAPCERVLPFRYGPAGGVPVELRGAGGCSRQVNNVASVDGFGCDQLLVVEVLTPGGNWSSFPPHKHDEHGPDESELEEIYYFEVDRGGAGYQRVYGAEGRPIDVLAEVRSGDVVLVPHGWHGPSMATPGYHLYYLNVMAGPVAERAWRIVDDPAHGWIRGTWAGQEIDPRLPLTSAPEVDR